jgi:hypothetical protein
MRIPVKTLDGWMPLVGADMDRIDSLRRRALFMARATGKAIKLVRFEMRSEVELPTPPGDVIKLESQGQA